jgi:hypothetical protein
MNTRAIIVLTVLLVFGWAGAALAGEICDKLPTAPGARLIVVNSPDQLAEAVGDPEELAVDDDPEFATAHPGDFVCIAANLLVGVSTTFSNPDLHQSPSASIFNTAINITIPNITIYGGIIDSTTTPPTRATLTAGAGLTAAIFEVGATGVQMALFPSSLGVDYRLAPFNATGNPTNVRITDPTFDCAGISATAITVLPGANKTVIELNTIGGLTGACSTAGVLVRADRDTNNDQARDDTDGDGVLEDTVGTRIRANTFDAQAGASGPAIWLEENVVGVGDPNVGALEDQPPFEQCTGATAGSNHTVIGSSSTNAGFAAAPPFGPVVGNGLGADDGNLITSTAGTGTWSFGIRSEGSHICIRGNVILTRSGASNPAVTTDGIRLDPGANGTAVWGNIIGSLQVSAPAVPAVGGDGIAVLGPFKLTSVTPDGDSLYDNIVGNAGSATQAALLGAADDGFVCQDERIFVQGSSQGAQRAVNNGDEGFDLAAGGDGPEGFGCTKRDAVFNNDAISNGDNGFEDPGNLVDNDAHGNGGHGFLVPGTAGSTLCGNVASQNGGDGFNVDDNNTFTNSGTFGSATCARGGNRALANGGDGFEIGGGNVFLPATVSGTPTIGGSPVHFAWCNGDNGVRMGTGGGDSNRIRRVSAINNRNNGFDTPSGSDDNHLSNNVAGNLAGTGAATPAACTPPGHPASAPALTSVPGGLNFGDQDNGWDNAGGTPASPNRAWRNTFGDPDFENSSTLGANFAGNAVNGIRTAGGSVVLEESSGTVGSTAAADLDGNGTSGEACNVITNNVAVGFYVASGSGANHQIDDFDGQGGTRLSNIYEQIGTAVDIEHDGTAGTILKAEGLWTLMTVGPTPDIDVGPSTGIVQVSSTRVHTYTTVSQLLAACVADGGSGGGGGGSAPKLGDVNLNDSFEQGDLDELLNALRNRASWLTDPTNPKFKASDVARPCGKITRADYNRLRSSWLRVQKGRSALKSQCGSKGTIGLDPASAPRLLTVLSGQAGAAGVRVAVYDFSGRLLLEQKATGAQVALDLVQRELANGVYLAVVESLAADGRTLVREVRKVIVLR